MDLRIYVYVHDNFPIPGEYSSYRVTIIIIRVSTVPFNYNFIFTRVNTRGTTRNIHSIPVTCLRGPRFLVACVVYFITGTTRVKQLLSLHTWNRPRVHSHV